MNIAKKIITGTILLAALAAQAKNPNIIYILADDLGIGELSCYGQEKMQTPNIDKMAKEGIQFSRHYSGSTVCAPSRCSLMTGLHSGHSIIRGNANSPIPGAVGNMHMPENTFTIAQLLKDNGYKTGIFGKWGLGAQESPTAPLKAGFDRFFGYNDQAKAHSYFPEYMWSDNEKVLYPDNKSRGNGESYSADLIHGEVLKYIDENKDNPFFIYYATTLPHADVISIEKYQKQFEGKFSPEKSFKGGGYVAQPRTYAAFAAMVYTLDLYVAEIFEKLEANGILDDTIVIFTSDNGTHVEGGHNPKFWNSAGGLRGNKRDLYEGGIRTPMIVYWKGKIAAGSKTDHISAFWDIMPTFADIIGVKAPEDTDGISMLPTLLGKGEQVEHDYLYWEFLNNGGKKAVVQGDWKLVALNLLKSPNYELYNLAEDRGEKNNVAAQNPEKLKELKDILEIARTPAQIPAFEFEKGNDKSKGSKGSKDSKKSKDSKGSKKSKKSKD